MNLEQIRIVKILNGFLVSVEGTRQEGYIVEQTYCLDMVEVTKLLLTFSV